jgi:hypothetical protein
MMEVAASSHICPPPSKLASPRWSNLIPPLDNRTPDFTPARIIYRAPYRDLVYGAQATATETAAIIHATNADAGRWHRRRLYIKYGNQVVEVFRTRGFSAHKVAAGLWMMSDSISGRLS